MMRLLAYLLALMLFPLINLGQDDNSQEWEAVQEYYVDDNGEEVSIERWGVESGPNWVEPTWREYEFDEDAYDRLSSELEYIPEERFEEVEKEAIVAPKQRDPKIDKNVWKIILFILIGAILILVLVRIAGLGLFRQNPPMPDGDAVRSRELSPESPRSELDTSLEEALSRNDFRLAVRIYFLLILQQLHETGMITWKPDKTNSDYLFELKASDTKEKFRLLATFFNWTWYGEHSLDRSSFNRMRPAFSDFLQFIKQGKS